MARTKFELIELARRAKEAGDYQSLKELEQTIKYNSALLLHLPYGHPDTLCPNGKLWREMNARGMWEEWSNRPWQTDFHNLGKTNPERMSLCGNGTGKCCSINTYIETPGGKTKVRDLRGGDLVKSWDNGVVEEKIGPPFKKGREKMYRLFFSNGEWIEVTSNHQILFDIGFLSSSTLLESAACLPRTSLECARLILLSDALRLMQKEKDFLFDYLAYSRLCDEQLLGALDTSRDDFPLQAGVLRHNVISFSSDDLENICTSSHQQADDHLSILDSCLRISGQELTEIQSYDSAPGWYEQSIQNIQQLQLELIAQVQASVSSSQCQYELVHPYAVSPSSRNLSIVAYQDLGEQDVWDFDVIRTNNYIAGGVVNHNSISGAYEAAIHATGLYPDWWDGYRFDTANHGWVGSITNEVQKDYIQVLMIGSDLGENLGTGFIPRHLIVGKPSIRQCGLPGVVHEVRVRHKSGGISTISFKTYEQGWRKWQASAPNWAWLDEEPDENIKDQKDIFSELQTRLVRTNGIMWVTYTPLLGKTALTEHFMSPKHKGITYVGATWDDAPHLNAEAKARLVATYPIHQVEARTKGVPMMGQGAIFKDVPEGDVTCAPFIIPSHWARIKGIDFGIDHPAGIGEIAWDRDKDVIYVIRSWKRPDCDIATHAEFINYPDPWVPVAWPHDGSKRQSGSEGKQLSVLYREHHVNLLGISARYDKDKGGAQAQWPVIKEVMERELKGKFKIFTTCHEYLEERRNYHVKDDKIVSKNDDVLKSVFYAIMMKRYAQMNISRPKKSIPAGFSTGL